MTSASSLSETGVSYPTLLGVSITLIVCTGVFVGIRVIANARAFGKLQVDDYISIFAVVLIAATFGLDYTVIKALTNPNTSLRTMLQYGVAVDFLSAGSMVGSKTPILLLYIRLFGVKSWLRISSFITLAVLTTLMFVSMVTIGVVCSPHNNAVSVTSLLRCSNWSANNGTSCGILSVVIDVVILVLPTPVIARLRLPTPKRVGLGLIFSVGILAIAASAVSLRFKYESISGRSADTTTAMFCTNIEWCVAIMVGCVPALNSFWSSIIVNSALYSRIISAFSVFSVQPSAASSENRQTRSHGHSFPISNAGESAENFRKSSVTTSDRDRAGWQGTEDIPMPDLPSKTFSRDDDRFFAHP